MMHRLAAVLSLCLPLLAAPAQAQTTQEDLVAPSLVYVKIHYTPTIGNFVGIPQEDQATGFFVSDDGFILTAYHLLDRMHEQGGDATVTVGISLGNPEAPSVTGAIVNGLAPLDVLLLKIRPDHPFTPVKLGTARMIGQGDQLYTSGFLNTELLTKQGTLANKIGPLGIGYLWAINVPVPAGMSGSPVYLADGTVVGVLKGQNKDDPSVGYMVPIEYADALIAHLRLRALEKENSALSGRLTTLETTLAALSAQLSSLGWKAASGDPTGGIFDGNRHVFGNAPTWESHCPEGMFATDVWTAHPNGVLTGVTVSCRPVQPTK